MNRKREAPTDAATSARAGAERAADKATNSLFNCNTAKQDRQDRFSELLCTGRSNALTAKQIAEIAGCQERDVTRSFQRERCNGKAICAAGGGYFIPEDAAELARYIRQLDHRLREIQKTRYGLEQAYSAMTGQMMLDLSPGGDGVDG